MANTEFSRTDDLTEQPGFSPRLREASDTHDAGYSVAPDAATTAYTSLFESMVDVTSLDELPDTPLACEGCEPEPAPGQEPDTEPEPQLSIYDSIYVPGKGLPLARLRNLNGELSQRPDIAWALREEAARRIIVSIDDVYSSSRDLVAPMDKAVARRAVKTHNDLAKQSGTSVSIMALDGVPLFGLDPYADYLSPEWIAQAEDTYGAGFVRDALLPLYTWDNLRDDFILGWNDLLPTERLDEEALRLAYTALYKSNDYRAYGPFLRKARLRELMREANSGLIDPDDPYQVYGRIALRTRSGETGLVTDIAHLRDIGGGQLLYQRKEGQELLSYTQLRHDYNRWQRERLAGQQIGRKALMEARLAHSYHDYESLVTRELEARRSSGLQQPVSDILRDDLHGNNRQSRRAYAKALKLIEQGDWRNLGDPAFNDFYESVTPYLKEEYRSRDGFLAALPTLIEYRRQMFERETTGRGREAWTNVAFSHKGIVRAIQRAAIERRRRRLPKEVRRQFGPIPEDYTPLSPDDPDYWTIKGAA